MSSTEPTGYIQIEDLERLLGQRSEDQYLYDRLVLLVAKKVFKAGDRVYSAFSLSMSPAERKLIMHRDPFDTVASMLGLDLGAEADNEIYLSRYADLKQTAEWSALTGQ